MSRNLERIIENKQLHLRSLLHCYANYGHYKSTNKYCKLNIIVKNPNWWEAVQLAIYKAWPEGVELGTTENKSSYSAGCRN